MPHTTQTEVGVTPDSPRGITRGMVALGVLNALVLCVGLALVLVYGGTQVGEAELYGSPSLMTERALKAEQHAEARAMVAAQVAELGCSRTPALSERVAVRNVRGDSGVVRVVSFDEGWALAQAGKVYTEGWNCS